MNKKKYKQTATNGYEKEIHNKMAYEYIQYVCEQARKNKQKVAEVCLSRLPNGDYLTKEDVENYANERNQTTGETFHIDGIATSIKIHLSKIETRE